jgi:hypothetical protein
VREVNDFDYGFCVVYNFFLSLFLSFFPSFHLSFFLSFLVWPLLSTHCRCRGLLLHLVKLNDTHIHTRYYSPGRGIGRLHRPIPDNRQHSQETKSNGPRPDSNPQFQQGSGRRTTALDCTQAGRADFTVFGKQIWGSHSGAVEDSSLLDYDAVCLGTSGPFG